MDLIFSSLKSRFIIYCDVNYIIMSYKLFFFTFLKQIICNIIITINMCADIFYDMRQVRKAATQGDTLLGICFIMIRI